MSNLLKHIFHCNAKPFALGPRVGLDIGLALAKFHVGKTNILVSKNAKICVTPNATPNTSQWNIGGVGFSGVGACVGHYISSCLCQTHFQWNMVLRVRSHNSRPLHSPGLRFSSIDHH